MKTRDYVIMAFMIALISVGAYIKIPVPVCPFTLQFFFTTIAGIILGGKKGALSVASYVFLGLIGIPVFTSGGGIAYIFQPTFGYLIGFILGAYITGTIVHSGASSMGRMFAGAFAGLLAVYAMGMAYYWFISKYYLGSPIGIWPLFLYCFILAVPGDIMLCIFSAVFGKRIVPVVKSYGLVAKEV